MDYKKALLLVAGGIIVLLLFFLTAWHIVIIVFVPFLGALAWSPKKVHHTKKQSPPESFENITRSPYEQGYQMQTPPKSAKRSLFTRSIAEPKQDLPGAMYEQLQTQSSEPGKAEETATSTPE